MTSNLIYFQDEDKLDLETGAPTIIQTRRKRKLTNTATFFVLAIGLLFLILGALGAIRLYQQLSKRNVYHSVIDLPIDHPVHEGSGWNDHYTQYEDHQNTFKQPMAWPQYLHEEFHIDIEKELYERITVPQPPSFTHGRRGRFIHDFSLNKTGIVDIEGKRCFVMPLDRTKIYPPRTLFEFMVKLKAKYYTVDTKMIRETMRVIQPPIEDYQSLGYFIARDCVGFTTYRLEKATDAGYCIPNCSVDDLFPRLKGGHLKRPLQKSLLLLQNIDILEYY
ncbi:Integral membrane protein 2B [Nymphon striatum]|nr:Integral membrane protein 2B [Nymphon striatum]